jgi:HEAT repeat protein
MSTTFTSEKEDKGDLTHWERGRKNRGKAAWAAGCLKNLRSANALVRWHAVNTLGDQADHSTCKEVLEYSLEERERHAAWRSLWAVSRFERSLTIPTLLRSLVGQDFYRRWRAALALSMMGRREAVPVLLEGLESDDDWIQWEALGGLHALHPSGVEQAVSSFLQPNYPRHIRQRAVLVLGVIGSEYSLLFLQKALGDPHPGVRWRASMGLRKTGGEKPLKILLKHRKKETDERVLNQITNDITLIRRSL